MDPSLQGKFDTMTITPKQTGTGSVSENYQIVNGVIPQIEIPDEKDLRFCVLSFEQVKRLNDLMCETIPIHGRGNFPTIDVKLCDLVSIVRAKLEADGIKVREIRLNGSGASSVLAADFNDSHNDISYNDLDLIFSVDLATGKSYDRVKTAVLDSLLELLPPGVSRKKMSSCSLKEAYVSKMVKVNDTDRWSLISLGNNRAKTVELKFVNNMKRQYEFSVDSFHIMLDTLFLFYECSTRCSVNGENPKTSRSMSIGDNFYPTVVAESMYGDFHEALYHLQKKLISTRNPEEIRGGGLLKYCNLLCKGYRPAAPEEVKNMERYMCSRFFIDFSDINQQSSKLENYLYNHFVVGDPQNDVRNMNTMKYEYLMILYQVVDESTVCLMGHERRLTLALIEDMAFQVYNPPYYPIPPPDYSNCNSEKGTTPELFSTESLSSSSVYDQSSSSSASTCSSMSTSGSSASSSASSTSSSGTTTPQKPPTPSPMQQVMAVPAALQQSEHEHTTTATITTTYQQIHNHNHTHPPPMATRHPNIPNRPPPNTTGLPATVAFTNQPPPSVCHIPSPQTPTMGQQQMSTSNCSATTTVIPTYEIVSSCQPAVIYSNGYYYTSYPAYPASSVAITDTTSPPPQISGQLHAAPTVQQLPNQQVIVSSQQNSGACTCTCSCIKWPETTTTNDTSGTVTLIPSGPPPSTQQQHIAPPSCCIPQQIVCT